MFKIELEDFTSEGLNVSCCKDRDAELPMRGTDHWIRQHKSGFIPLQLTSPGVGAIGNGRSLELWPACDKQLML